MALVVQKVGLNVDRPIVVVGEALMDCARSASGADLHETPGGSPMNVAIGLGRLGHPVVLAARVGSDLRGRAIVDHLAGSGVRLIDEAMGLTRTSTATAIVAEDGSATYEFDLVWDLTAEMVSIEKPLHVHTGSIGATLEPGASEVLDILARERRNGASISYDPNARPHIMGSPERALATVEAIIAVSDVVKASDEDIEWFYPGQSIDEVVGHWKSLGVLLVVITRGAGGATAWGHGAPVSLPTYARVVVDTIGAGDTVMSGLISALASASLLGAEGREALAALSGERLESILDFALRAAAITVARAGANPPTLSDMNAGR
jgi:fructokinase